MEDIITKDELNKIQCRCIEIRFEIESCIRSGNHKKAKELADEFSSYTKRLKRYKRYLKKHANKES